MKVSTWRHPATGVTGMVPSKPAPVLLAGIWNCWMREDLVAIDWRLHASELEANRWGSVETKGT